MDPRQKIALNIAKEYTPQPGPRTREEGHFSAEQFMDEVLLDKFDKAVSGGAKLIVELDGGYGYGTSFLEEAFGGLARKRGIAVVLRHIEIRSEEEPYLRDDVLKYIREAETGSQKRR
jgi:STAS-like domain of unknown function (DUF4325)